MAASVRSRPESPREWTPEDVVEFLTDPKAVGLPQSAAAAFSANQIDGRALLELTTEEVRSELGLVLGHRKTLFRAINRLKATFKATSTKAGRTEKHSAPALPAPGTTVSNSAEKSDTTIDSPASPEESSPAAATSATPRSADAASEGLLTCAGCGCTKAPNLFSSRQRKIAAHRPARCIECAQGAAASSSRATPTELQPYMARELRPAEAAGYKASGVLPMRRSHDGTLEVLLALERRQDWAIRGRGDKSAKAKPEQDHSGDSKNLLAASGRVEGNFLHPIGGTREADDDGAIATAAREFGEEVGHVLPTEGSNSGAVTQASIDMLKGARGRYVLWQPRGKYALWVYFLPAEQADLAEKFGTWKASKETSPTNKTAGEQSMIDVQWVPVSMDGTVQIGQHTLSDTDDAKSNNGHLATSFCMELLQRKALRQHLAQTGRRLLRLQLSVGSASPAKASGRASTPSPLAQSPMLTVAAEALLSKRLAAATPSPTQKKQRKGKKRSAGDAPGQSDAKRLKDVPKDAPTDVEIAAVDATAPVTSPGDTAAKKQAKKRAKKQRKSLTTAKRKSADVQNKNDSEEEVSSVPSDHQSSSLKRKQPEASTEKVKVEDEPQASNDAAESRRTDVVESHGDSKADFAAADANSCQGKVPAVATVEKEAQCNQEDQPLFVEDRAGSHANADCTAGSADGKSGAEPAAPKKLNRAERKQQRKLAHAARLKAKAAASDSDAASLLVSSEKDKNVTTAAAGGAPSPIVAEAASSVPTFADSSPLPSPRTLGKFRFTGTGLHIG